MKKSKLWDTAFTNVWDMAIVVKDINATVNRLEALGIGPFTRPEGPAGAGGLFYKDKPYFSNSKALVTRMGNMHIEIIQPDEEPNNPWREWLNRHGEGIHHLGLQVDDVETDVKTLTDQGAEVPFFGKINGKVGAAYIDLKVSNLIFELTSFGYKNAEEGKE